MLYNILLIWIYDLFHQFIQCECFNAVHLPTALAFLAAGNVYRSVLSVGKRNEYQPKGGLVFKYIDILI